MQNKNKDVIIDLNSNDLFEFVKTLGQQTEFQGVVNTD